MIENYVELSDEEAEELERLALEARGSPLGLEDYPAENVVYRDVPAARLVEEVRHGRADSFDEIFETRQYPEGWAKEVLDRFIENAENDNLEPVAVMVSREFRRALYRDCDKAGNYDLLSEHARVYAERPFGPLRMYRGLPIIVKLHLSDFGLLGAYIVAKEKKPVEVEA